VKITRDIGLPGLVLVEPVVRRDPRGYFCETFRADALAEMTGGLPFVQDNQSLSMLRGTLRGLHGQHAPHEQGKLVRCLAGALFDVAVDIRPGSPTYGKFATFELSADNFRQLWVPPGFLHGFCTLTENTIVAYKVTAYYNAAADFSIRHDDAEIGIAWPDCLDRANLSPKDRDAPGLAAMMRERGR
jgi:dTDP-4-dehydrorhamnose 3,5-epimerase